MRVVFAGTPQAAVPSLRALLASRHEVVAVVTRPDARAGRGRRSAASPVRLVAEEHGLPVLTPERASEEELGQELRRWAPQACPVVAYGGLIRPELLDIPTHGWVNLHFSLLPAWRGAAPVQHALLHGDEVSGASTFLLEAGLDTGPVLGTMTEQLRPRDTAGEVLERLAQSGAALLVSTLDALEDGRAQPVPQPSVGISLAPKLSVADARIDWRQPAFAIERRIRACTPAPGAWCMARGQRVKLHPARVVEGEGGPGVVTVSKNSVVVGTGSGAVELGIVQPEGKKPMPAADWARGVRLESAEVWQ